MREFNGFADGNRYSEIYPTSSGALLIDAELLLVDDTITLRDVLLEPLETRRISAGVPALLQIWRKLLTDARAQGYTYVQVEATRTSGANPHHSVFIRRHT